MKKRLKINGVIMFFVILAVVVFPGVFFRRDCIASFDEVAEILGVVLILLGQLFRISARGYKSEHSQNGRSLITTGPYAAVRNPMYLGILLIGLGIVFVLFNWWVVIIFLFVFIVRYLLLIFKEEKKLLALFPQTYQDYCRRVPRIFPSIRILVGKDIGEYLPLRLSWVKREIGSILTVLLITLFIESWEDIRSTGFRIYLHESVTIIITVIIFIFLVIYLSKRTERFRKDGASKNKNNL
mgnify:CR=1 FL=1